MVTTDGDSVGGVVNLAEGRRVGTSVSSSDGTSVGGQVALPLGLSLVGYDGNKDSFTLILFGALLGGSITLAFDGNGDDDDDDDCDGTRVGTSVIASEGRRVGTGMNS